MIGIYYTGASTFGSTQTEPSKSLGGYISSSKIPNKLLGNLFSSISGTVLQNGVEESRCIALKNEGGSPITSFKLSIQLEEHCVSTFNGFLILPAVDDCNNPYFEKLSNPLSIPTIGELTPIGGENMIEVDLSTSPLQPGSYLGFWLQRVIQPIEESINSLECQECHQLYEDFQQGKSVEKKEIYKLLFDYL